MYWSLHAENSSLGVLCIGLGMLRYHVKPLDDRTLLLDKDLEDTSSLALVIASIYHDDVAFLDMKLAHLYSLYKLKDLRS